MDTLNQDILKDIDKIDEMVMESEMSVINALCNVYEKSCMILENCEDNDCSCFDIFQESVIMKASDGIDKKENIIKKILLFIPRLIMSLVRKIKSAWDNRKSQQLIRRIEELENLTSEQKQQIEELQSGNDKTDSQLKKLAHGVVNQFDKQNQKIDGVVNNLDTRMKDVQVDVKRYGIENERLFAIIDTMNGVIKTHIKFDDVLKYYDDILSTFDVLENWDIHKPSTLPKDCINMINRDLKSGKSTDGHTWILGGEEYRCKYSVFTNYISEWNRRRDDVCKKGKALADKIDKMGKTYQAAIDEPNKRQQVQLDNVNLVLKYIQNVVKSTMACEKIISSHMNHVEALLHKYNSMINPK